MYMATTKRNDKKARCRVEIVTDLGMHEKKSHCRKSPLLRRDRLYGREPRTGVVSVDGRRVEVERVPGRTEVYLGELLKL